MEHYKYIQYNKYINTMEQISILKYISDTKFNKMTVLDVRGKDFIGGNIPKAINISSLSYDKIKKYVEPHSDIIVHCMYSSLRGPGVVKRLMRDYPSKNIILLEGGFNKYFNHMIKIDPSFIENLDLSLWKCENGNYINIKE